ncbi:GEVED domain-containing protein [Flavobacterium capsici]|uniref:GEVED domain-containing protein n=1 Tax=Flavobacterium capsici TaxID=3075618 RepID=A0AA96F092_9FLAO|nr:MULTISPECIES: GEVED domain-containing protein [unclassified Flavobacterium]WNM18785.1 GEVED domain-containing protein [Flavobacterium sp. PMR2A8]WNM22836.1 GEVED domain-containing protein [Flavobacterium sp. PMTSA4]
MMNYYTKVSTRSGTWLKKFSEFLVNVSSNSSVGKHAKASFLCTLLLSCTITFGTNPKGDDGIKANSNVKKVSVAVTTCPSAIQLSPAALPTNQALVCGGTNDLTSANTTGGNGDYKGGNEALYKITPTLTGSYTIAYSGQSWSSIFVYQGCPSSGGTYINSVSSSSTSKSLAVTLTAGTEYYIWFDTWPTPNSPCAGTFTITAPAAPCVAVSVPYTQNFESVITPALPTCTTSQNAGTGNNWTTASVSGNGFASKVLQYAYNSSSAANAWFYTAPLNLVGGTAYSVTYKYGNNSTTYVEKLRVAFGTSALNTAMTNVLANHPNVAGGNPSTNTVYFTPASSGVYYIGFNAYSAADQFNLYVDDIAVGLAPTCTPPSALAVSFTPTLATLTWNAPGTPPANGYEYAFTTSATPPTSGTAGASGVSVSGSYAVGQVYYLHVRSICTSPDVSAWATQQITVPLFNDACSGAISIACGGSITTSLVGSTNESQAVCGISGVTTQNSAGIWYKFTGDGQDVVISTGSSPTNVDTRLAVYSGTCGSLTCLGGNDDTVGLRAEVAIPTTNGVSYYILLYSWSATTPTADIVLTLTCTPACTPATGNDECATAATVLVGTPLNTNNTCATPSADSYPTCGSSFGTFYDSWYTFNSGSNTVLEISAIPTSTALVGYAVYSGSCGSLTQVSCTTSGAAANITLTANTVYKIRVFSTSTANRGDFTLRVKIPCLNPTGLTVTGQTTTSATLNWSAPASLPGSGYEYEIRTSGAAGSGATGLVASGTALSGSVSVTINTLDAGTLYTAYLRAVCGPDDTSSWSSVNFATLCNPVTSFPWTETFETSSTTLPCFRVIDGNADGDFWGISTTNPRTGSQSARLYTDFNSSNQDYLITPQLSIGTTPKRLKFWVRSNTTGEPDEISVKVSTTGTSIANFTATAFPSTLISSTSYVEYIVDLSAFSGNIYLAFVRENDPADGWYLNLDDITVENIPPSVSSFTPTFVCGQAGGSVVTITGANFAAGGSVYFNGIAATNVTVVNSTTIQATVPAGDVTGYITVTGTNGSFNTATNFETRPFPAITPIEQLDGLNAICGTDSIALTNGTANGVWDSSNPAVATVNFGTVTGVDAGATTITYTVSENGCSSVSNYPITVSNPIQITSNPATPVNSITGSSASFTVEATGTIVSYQWLYAIGSGSFNPVPTGGVYSGINSPTLTISATTSSMNNYRFRCRITGSAPCPSPINSTIALLKVGNTGIATNPSNVNLCNGGQAQFTVVPVGDVDEYFWFEVTEEGVDFDNPIVNGGDYSGANTATLTVSNVSTSNHNGAGYLVMVVGPANSPVSPAAYINVSVPATIGTHPTNQTVCYSGGSASFTASASNTLGYQWQFSTVGGANDANWTTITSAAGPAGITYSDFDTATLHLDTTGAISPAGTYFYRAVALSGVGCPNTNSTQAQLLINNPAVAIATPNGTVVCGGTAVTLTASGADSYSWSTGASTASISVAPASQTTYTVTGTTTGCSKQASVIVTVGNAVTATASSDVSSVCINGTAQLNAVGSQLFTTPTPNLYNFSTNTSGSIASMSGATLIGSGPNDDTPYAASNIGFTFNFNGTNYTQFSASPDGFITLGSATASSQFTNSMTSSTNVPKIAAYWDDLALGTDGAIRVKTIGTAPNRICVIEWFVTIPRNTTGTANSTFQLWLYESTNNVEMVYGSMNSGTMSASVGIKGSSTGNYSSVTVSTNTTSTSSANNSNSGQPSNGRVYRFVPSNAPTFTYAWTATPADATLIATTSASPAVNPTVSTTYQVVVTAASGCKDTKTVSIAVQSGVNNFVQPTAQTFCAGQTASLSVSASGPGLQYNWYKVGNVSPVGTSATLSFVNATVAQSGNYYVVVTPACGSAVTSNTVTLTVNPLPTATISGTTTVCTNGTAPTVTFTGSNGTAPYTFTYTINGGSDLTIVSNASGVATLVAPIVSSGTYVYALKSVQGQLCSQSVTGQSATITVNAAPTPVAISGTNVLCANSNPVLLTASGGTTNQSYCSPFSVSNTGSTGDYLNNFTFANLTNNNSGDAASDYTYYSGLTANVVANGTTAYPISLQAGGTTSLYTQQFRVWIDFNQNGIFETSESVYATTTATFAPSSATGTVVIPTTALNGITRMRVASKYSSAVADTESCSIPSFGEFEDYNVSITGGVSAPLVVWSSANGGLFTDAAGTTAYNGTTPRNTIYARPTASGDVTAIVTNNSGCSNSGSFAITVNPVPTASISGTTAVCHNSASPSVTFTGANASAPYTFTYSLTNVATNTTTSHTVTTTTGNSVTVVAPTNVVGTFVYDLLSVQDSSSTACSQAQSGSATVTVNPLPTATIAGTTQVCQNDTAPLVTFTGANGTAPYTFTYKLNNGSNQTVVSTGNSATVAAPTGVAGTFAYTLVSVQDSSSSTCSQAQAGTATIVVHPTPMVTTVLTNQYYYSGFATAAIPLSGTPSGVTFNITGGAAAGLPNMTVTDAIPSFIPTAVPATVTVTPVANGCTGIPKTYQIIFNPVVVNILSNHCGSVNNGLNNQIQANSVTVPGYTTTGYRFEITNLSTGEVAYVDTVQSHFKLTDTNIYAYGTTYAIRAAAYLNGQLQGYFGNTCNLTTASVQTTKVINSQCGATLAAINSSINADVVNSTNLYRFRVARADAPTTYYYVERTVANFNLTMVAGLPLTFDTEYKVDVQIRVKLAGFEAWSQFGQVCSIFTPAAPIAGLTDTYCDEYHVTSSSQLIYAISFANATEYKFRLDDGNGNILYATSATNSFSLNMVSGWAPNTLYAVAVSMKLFGSYTDFELSKNCSILTPQPARLAATPFSAVAYPNPFAENFKINVKSSNDGQIDIKVYDMVGRLVEQRTAMFNEIDTVTIGDSYPSGVYNVIVSQNEDVKTVRVIKR